MEITKDDKNLIVKIPLTQPNYDAIQEYIGDVPNIVGVIAGEEMTISQLNALGYKDDIQEGMPLIHFYGEEKEFIKICDDLGISVWEHTLCGTCGKVIYGAFTANEQGPLCWDCENPKCTTCHKGYATELSDTCSDCLENS